MTEQEKEELIDKVAERVLLKIPEIVGTLIQNQVAMKQLNTQFFNQHPELKTEIELLRSVIEQVESANPGMPYKQVIDKAYPIIKDRLKIKQSVNMTDVKTPNRQVSTDLGEL